jgi:hypothetical protein
MKNTAIEWLDNKIKMLEAKRNEMSELKNKIDTLEAEINALKSLNKNFNIDIVFSDSNTGEAISTHNATGKYADDMKFLLIYNKTKELGMLKQRYDNFNPGMYERLLDLRNSSVTGPTNK